MIKVELTPLACGTYAWHSQWEGTPLNGFGRQPLLDACRAAKQAGAPTTMEIALFRDKRSDWSLKTTVGYGASQTVEETRKIGPVFRKWRPFAKV